VACAQWRDQIREKLAAGWTDAEVKEYFVAQYGDRVLAEPPRRGLNWLAYLVPPVGLLIGAVILFQAMRTWQKPTPEIQPGDVPTLLEVEDEYLARIEAELQKRQ
jgi:cytochrome c-type biogenesis protein CcmH